MSHRSTLRATVLVAFAAGAVLVPSAAAFTTDSPKPTAPSTEQPTPRPAESAPTTASPAPPTAPPAAVPSAVPSEVGQQPTRAPRGGVAAGEQPAGSEGGSGALYGSAACAVLMAGAGTIVLRRRSAAQRNG